MKVRVYYREDVLKRFFRHINIIPESNCLFWTGCKSWNGYGRFHYMGKLVHAHRFIWEHCNGKIPIGYVADHLCKVPSCVNTSHVRMVTPKQNVTENSSSPSALNKAKTHCKRGHEFNGITSHVNRQGKRQCLLCRDDRSSKWRKANPEYFKDWRKKKREGS